MKIFKNILKLTALILLTASCNEGIDPISHVDPGPDQSAPVIKIKYPTDGVKIEVPQQVTSITVKSEITDDIELKSVSVLMDNQEIKSYTTFKDYRRLLVEYLYDNVTTGSHVLTVKATDLQGKTSESSVSFIKKPPYTPLFDGEVFYMPFDGDYVEKITFLEAGKVGSPGFAGSGLKGIDAYKGAADSYLTFPSAGVKSNNFTAAFWYKVNATPDRSGILNASVTGENRNFGFRLFREGSAAAQRIKLNVGTGTGEVWNDGQEIATNTGKWVHIAFTVSASACTIYINGAVAASVPATGIDWTGCDQISIESGAPNFTYWSHNADLSQYDELRMFNKALSQAEILSVIQNDSPYVPLNAAEKVYIPFEGSYKDLIGNKTITKIGAPDFSDGKTGKAYTGAAASYLTVPLAGLTGTEFSATFWYKVNSTPDRSGIINASATGENRNLGFRLFREGSATKQRIKLNVGTGTGETWNDGAELDVPASGWVHIGMTISASTCVIYFNGEVAGQTANTGLDWTGLDAITIGSGAPNFTYWGHDADLSQYDELRFFNKALTQDEVKFYMNSAK